MTARADEDQAMYVISVAADLAGVHPQTLRVYERKGLVRPSRTSGNTRRYSHRDIERLKKIQRLSQEGVNLAGVERIIELEGELERLASRHRRALRQIERLQEQLREAAAARHSASLVPLKEVLRIRRAMKSDALEAAARRRTFAAPPVGLTGTDPRDRSNER